MIGERKRFWELDFIRGLCVILMIFDHAMFSLGDVLPSVWDFYGKRFWVGLSGLAVDYWSWRFREIFRIFVFTAFFVVCGISCTFSRSNLKRGFKAFLVAAAITYVTAAADTVMDAGLTIRFGVIHMLAFAMIFYGLIDLLGGLIVKIKDNSVTVWIRRLLPGFVGLIFLILYFALWGRLSLSGQSVGFISRVTVNSDNPMAQILYAVMDINGVNGFYSADYFPLLPYALMVLIGSLIGWLIYHTKCKDYLSGLRRDGMEGICFFGRHALIFYIVHQIAIVALLFVIGFFATL